MDEDAAQGVRRKKDSTLVRAAEAVRDGRASAMVSAGNTGATMASALLRMGRIKGVSRPAIATPIPVPGSQPNVLLDAGANAEVQPEWLVQFAQMGSVFARHRFGIDAPEGRPAVDRRGAAARATRCARRPSSSCSAAPGINFIGNVEGRDMMPKTADVDRHRRLHRQRRAEDARGRPADADRRAARGVRRRREVQAARRRAAARARCPLVRADDPDTYGGAVLLGVDGVCIISHGSSARRRCSTPSRSPRTWSSTARRRDPRPRVARHA